MPAPTSPVVQQFVVDQYLGGLSAYAIKERHGISTDIVYDALRRRGISRRPHTVANRRHTVFAGAFDAITDESAYWLGMLVTDGCLSGPDRYGGYQMTLSAQAADWEHLESFRRFMGASHPVRSQGKATQRLNGRAIAGGTQAFLSLKAPPHLSTRLLELGIHPRKSATAFAHPLLALNPHFWRGCIDGDGTVMECRKLSQVVPCIKLNSASEKLIGQFRDFVRYVVPDCAANVRRGHSTYNVHLTCSTAVVLIARLYDETELALPRKLLAARHILARAASDPSYCSFRKAGRARMATIWARGLRDQALRWAATS